MKRYFYSTRQNAKFISVLIPVFKRFNSLQNSKKVKLEAKSKLCMP